MINSILNSTLNRASFALSDSKDKILTIAKKRAQENLNFDIPSPQDLKNKFSGLDPNDIESIEQAQNAYKKAKSLLEKAINRLERSKRELISIKDKLLGISEKLDTLNNFIGPDGAIGRIIPKLRSLPLIIDGVLASQVTPIVSGTVIDKVGDIKKAIKNSLDKFDNAIQTLPPTSKYFNQETEVLLTPLNIGIDNIQIAIDKLQFILDQINSIFTDFITSSNLIQSTAGDTTTGDQDSNTPLAGTTLEEYLSNPENLSDIIEKLIIPTRKIYYEVRDNGPGSELREAGIIEEPIN